LSCSVTWAIGCQRRRAQVSSIWAAATAEGTIGTSRQSASQLRFDRGGFTGGTSGSPWVTHFDPRTHSGIIVGVIGGYQEGSNTAAISYSSNLGAEVQRLYQEAIADQAPAAG